MIRRIRLALVVIVCVVLQTGRPADEPHYGTITGYRADDGTWQATGGVYDFLNVGEANRNAAERAGIPVATRRLRRQRALAVLTSRPYDKSQESAENEGWRTEGTTPGCAPAGRP